MLPVRSALLACLAMPVGALAQTVPPRVAPPALQENPVDRTAQPELPRLSPSIQPPPVVPQTGPGAAAQVRIGRISVQGSTAVPAATLRAAVPLQEGQAASLAEIEDARLAVLRAYRAADYPFASVAAGLTPRPDGTADLAFAVTEGYVEEVKLEGDIGPAGTQVLRFLNRLVDQRPASGAAIERALLLASDIPGVTVRGVLRPLPSSPGALQLVAQVERKWYSGYFNIDNRGYRLTGPWEGLLVAGLNSFTEFGERTELALFGGEANNQSFVQGSVEAFVGGSGLRVRLYAGGGRARPGSPLAALGYEGDTAVGGLAVSYPIIRSRPMNLYAVGQFDVFDSTVDTGVGASSARLSRDGIRTLRAGLDGQALDSLISFLPPATTLGGFRVSQGLDILGATGNDNDKASRAGSQFDFLKISAEVQRTQPLFSPFENSMVSVQALLQGQYSDDVLPTAEKFYLGGARLGRGFYSGQITGDKAFGVAMELQFDLAMQPVELPGLGWTLQPTPQFYAFRDIGRTWENQEVDRDRRLSSWGIGLRLPLNQALQVDVEGVERTTRQPDGAGTERLKEYALFFRTLVRF
ncbi:BamA/TamA family outer membrane protein [Roseomonas sp. OT10]|uniref:ShlB/FhaC/HecB family hemolysin secretion/activation protein n=1 Tax=Roseomonas cutis TaxID=2897332 RepID=UPI001E4343EE|nr:ShlB/FhaC/HecB family hemolysin secretion/activation protein [Roseomonas sp. OT10]UFN49513.1 BamA/TamA family outer membrane protein [Roseomonas sp. OT10]